MTLPPPEAFKRIGFKIRERSRWTQYKEWRQHATEKYQGSALLAWSSNFRKGPDVAERR